MLLASYWLLFTTFAGYDDEGYVLLSLKNFSLHGRLYEEVYTQYGPFQYLLFDGLHRLFGLPFTNTMGRWVTLITWCGTAGLCALIVGRQTRSVPWSAFTLAGVFTYLWTMIHEPVHPGGLLSFLVALGAWLGTETWARGKFDLFAAGAALVGAALALTKINVGVFFLGAAFTWLAVNNYSPRGARALAWTIAIGCALLPFVLMRALQGAPWVRLFGLVFIAASISALLAARHSARPVVQLRTWWILAGGFAVVAGLGCGLTLLRGTSLQGMLAGMVLEPLKHPGVYFLPMRWGPGTGVLALVTLAGLVLAANPSRFTRPGFSWAIAIARLAALASFLSGPPWLLPVSSSVWGMSYGVTLAGLFALPLASDARGPSAAPWVALVLVFQFLHAYPVAGTQISWGTYLCVPLLAIGTADAVNFIRERRGRPAQSRGWLLAGQVIISGIALFMTIQLSRIGWHRYHTAGNPRLGIPGTGSLRLVGEQTYALRILHENLCAQADMIFSLPGLYSFNLWTGLPTPTLANATHWFSLLSEPQQQAIIQRLAASPRPILVIQRELVEYLARTGFHARGTLHAWVQAEFQRSFFLGRL